MGKTSLAFVFIQKMLIKLILSWKKEKQGLEFRGKAKVLIALEKREDTSKINPTDMHMTHEHLCKGK